MKNLPTFKITIDPAYSEGEKLGIDKIAHTATPAIKIKGVAFRAADLHPNCKCEIETHRYLHTKFHLLSCDNALKT